MFTTGKWKYGFLDGRENPCYVYRNDKDTPIETIAKVYSPANDNIYNGSENNARLIAAAPEMYNALNKIARDGEMTPEDGERFLHEVVIPLLAKVEGK